MFNEQYKYYKIKNITILSNPKEVLETFERTDDFEYLKFYKDENGDLKIECKIKSKYFFYYVKNESYVSYSVIAYEEE